MNVPYLSTYYKICKYNTLNFLMFDTFLKNMRYNI